jgi:signal transduction histidine kinase
MHIKKLVVQKELINFEKIITEIQAELQNTPNYMLVRWDINIDVVSNFYTDIALFKTIVKNLAENSIKYARFYNNTPLIQLIIENKSANNMLSLTVMDNGQGIIKEQIPKIFDMFHRGTDNNSSIGLGLYTLKNALDKLHGTIDVKSIYGSGTTFTVQIPN